MAIQTSQTLLRSPKGWPDKRQRVAPDTISSCHNQPKTTRPQNSVPLLSPIYPPE